MNLKQLRQIYGEAGFKIKRLNGKHEIYTDGTSTLPLPRGAKLKSRDAKNVLANLRRAVRKREEMRPIRDVALDMSPQQVLRINHMVPPSKTVAPQETITMDREIAGLQKEEQVTASPQLIAQRGKELREQGKTWEQTTEILRHQKLIDPKFSVSGLCTMVLNAFPEMRTKHATKKRKYTKKGESTAEIVLKLAEHILTIPEISSDERLQMLRKVVS